MPGSWAWFSFFSLERYRNGHRALTRVKNALGRNPGPVRNHRVRFTRDFRSRRAFQPVSRKVLHYIKIDSEKKRYTDRSRDTLPPSLPDASYHLFLFFLFSFLSSYPLKACSSFVASIVGDKREEEKENTSNNFALDCSFLSRRNRATNRQDNQKNHIANTRPARGERRFFSSGCQWGEARLYRTSNRYVCSGRGLLMYRRSFIPRHTSARPFRRLISALSRGFTSQSE